MMNPDPSLPLAPAELDPMTPTSQRHSAFEDLQALLAGPLLLTLGVALYAQVGIWSGGTSGLALLLFYGIELPFGVGFFFLNLPFYVLAWRTRGWRFTLKTFLAVLLVSLLSHWQLQWIFIQVKPLYAAVMGGLLMGTGLLILFRHQASLGGIGILSLYLQQKRGWRAGWVQLGFDVLVLLAATGMSSWTQIGLSILGAVVLNLTLAINHRPDRYTAI